MMKGYYSLLTFVCIIFFHAIGLSANITENVSDVNLTQIHLTNGMTVWLKPTQYETDEVLIKLAALGGFASLKPSDRYSGELAAQIAWESGMDGMTSDQISVLLYEHSLEFVPKIHPFSRVIEGTATSKSVGQFLQCVNMVFLEQNFTKEGFEAALATARRSLALFERDYDHVYEAEFLKVNTQGLSVLTPMHVDDLEKVDFNKAKEFFHQCFINPSDFICVIVGNFDLDQIKKLVHEHLESIPKMRSVAFVNALDAPFPKGITQKEFQLKMRPDSLTRLTFPVKMSLDEESIQIMAFSCQIIEARLRQVITQQMELSYGVDVSYEFPLFPYLNHPWISIRFRCDPKLIESLKHIVTSELQKIQIQGVSKTEIEEIYKLEAASDEYWLRDNFYWTSMLANYYLWQWNPESIYHGVASINGLSQETVNSFLKNSISLKNYSIVTAKP